LSRLEKNVNQSDIINISDEETGAASSLEPWIVICADDDESAHRSTAFALDGELIEGRPVKLISAYSAIHAIEMVKKHPEAAALLLDVVMETPMAGLEAIEVIRETLRRKSLRIIVRSGAPGLMSELETVKRFDITDWRPKNELNQSRLLSAITLAVRAFEELNKLDRRSAGLDKAMSFLERLAKEPGSEVLMSDLLGGIEDCMGSSVWVLAINAEGHWRASSGPLASIPAEQAAWGESALGSRESSKIEAWLSQSGRSKRMLEAIEVSGSLMRVEMWTSKPHTDEEWHAEQNRALVRALSSALAGQEKARLEREALLRDSATGLLSRQGFIEKCTVYADHDENMVIYLIDLVGFARVNSALGHEAGDEILRQAGKRIQDFSGLRLCARIGSDAFAVLMPKCEYKAERLESCFEEPMSTAVFPIPMKPRVSAAIASEGESVGAWLTKAAAAMEEAKAASVSGGEPRWFDPRSKSLAMERMALSQKMFVALRDKQGMFMVFQPQVNLIDKRVTGCEALIRWKENDVFIPPDKFIPIAEQSGLAMAISEFALSESLAMMKRLRAMGLAMPRVSVNLSPVEFETGDLLGRVTSHIDKQGCKPSDLMIEITETAAAKDPERMVEILRGLRGAGVKVAIDDFGSGYSSLAQLARLPIDELKIDRAFVNALGQDGPFSSIAKMIVDLSSSMQLEVVAEGVEREEQANMLLRLGVHSAQGWLYAKGMPEAEFFNWLIVHSSVN
jgi:diguanylate cyclase (GGDEF)-like protein